MNKKIYIAAILLSAPYVAVHAQNVSATVERSGSDFTISYQLPLQRPSSDYAYIISPFVCSPTDTLAFTPIVIRGARNARKLHRYYALEHKGETMPTYIKASEMTDSVLRRSVTVSAAAHPWLYNSPAMLCLRTESEGCCDISDMGLACSESFLCRRPFAPVVIPVEDNTGKAGLLQRDNPVLLHISKYRPYDDTRVLSREKGALYVHFPLDKWDLRHDYRNNAPTLDRIVDITRQILADTTSTVKCIQIVGLASPEGPLARNKKLSRERAIALKKYIRRHVATPDSLYELNFGGEAWAELRAQIEDSKVEYRDEMLAIIDTEKDLNKREQRLKTLRGGKPYRYLRDNVFSDQRNSGYLRIYYDYVPDSNAAQINQATAQIKQGNYAEALRMLQKVKTDPRAQNALGVALYMTGSEQSGKECFRRAAEAGNEQAAENLKQLE